MSSLEGAINNRRSVRRFTAEVVDRKDIEKMLAAAIRAPSGGNRQPWRFVVVSNKNVLASLRDVIIKGIEALPGILAGVDANRIMMLQNRYRTYSLFFADAPVAIFAFCDSGGSAIMEAFRLQRWSPADVERESGYVGVQSVAAAIENLLLMAHELGYGACWMNPAFFAREEISRMLEMPSPLRPIAIIPVGKPAELPAPSQRKPLDHVTKFID